MKDVNSIYNPRHFILDLNGHTMTGLLREAKKNGKTLEQELTEAIQFIYGDIESSNSNKENKVDLETSSEDN